MPTSTPIKPNNKYLKNCERAMSHQARLGYGQNKHGDNKLNYSPPKTNKNDKNKSLDKSSENRKSSSRSSSRRTPSNANNNDSSGSNDRPSDIRKSTKRRSNSRESKSPAKCARSSGDDVHIENGHEEYLAFRQVIRERKELREQVDRLKACLEVSVNQNVELTEEKNELSEKLWTHKCLRSQMKKRAIRNPCKFIDGKWVVVDSNIRIEIGAKANDSEDRDVDSDW